MKYFFVIIYVSLLYSYIQCVVQQPYCEPRAEKEWTGIYIYCKHSKELQRDAHFATFPINETDAKNNPGKWEQVSVKRKYTDLKLYCPYDNKIKDGDKTVCLLFNKEGYVVGIQLAFLKKNSLFKNPLWSSRYGVINRRMGGKSYATITIYFRKKSDLQSEKFNKMIKHWRGLYVEDTEGVFKKVPKRFGKLKKSFIEFSSAYLRCTMFGLNMNLTQVDNKMKPVQPKKSENDKCPRIFPIFPFTYQGQLSGFVFLTQSYSSQWVHSMQEEILTKKAMSTNECLEVTNEIKKWSYIYISFDKTKGCFA